MFWIVSIQYLGQDATYKYFRNELAAYTYFVSTCETENQNASCPYTKSELQTNINLAIDSYDQMLNGCKHFIIFDHHSHFTQISLLFGNFEEEVISNTQ